MKKKSIYSDMKFENDLQTVVNELFKTFNEQINTIILCEQIAKGCYRRMAYKVGIDRAKQLLPNAISQYSTIKSRETRLDLSAHACEKLFKNIANSKGIQIEVPEIVKNHKPIKGSSADMVIENLPEENLQESLMNLDKKIRQKQIDLFKQEKALNEMWKGEFAEGIISSVSFNTLNSMRDASKSMIEFRCKNDQENIRLGKNKDK